MSQDTSSSQSTDLNYNSGQPSFNPPGPFTLYEADELKIYFVGFPSGSTLTNLLLQSTSDPSRQVTFPPQGGTPDIFSVAANSSTSPMPAPGLVVSITDSEKPSDEDVFELSLGGDLSGGGSWSADPEVINKPGRG